MIKQAKKYCSLLILTVVFCAGFTTDIQAKNIKLLPPKKDKFCVFTDLNPSTFELLIGRLDVFVNNENERQVLQNIYQYGNDERGKFSIDLDNRKFTNFEYVLYIQCNGISIYQIQKKSGIQISNPFVIPMNIMEGKQISKNTLILKVVFKFILLINELNK